MASPLVPAPPPESPRDPSRWDEIVHTLVREIGPRRFLLAVLVALIAVLAAILGLAAIVVPYLAAAGAFGIVLGGLAKLVRACRNRS